MSSSLQPFDFIRLAPLLILFGGGLLIVLLESFFSANAKKLAKPLSFLILMAGLISTFFIENSASPLISNWIRFDHLGQVFTLVFLLIGMGIILLSPPIRGEYYFLILAALCGLILVGISNDLLILFLGIEALSISLYILTGFYKTKETSSEAAIKYFLTGALATAFLIYGIALVYGATGSTSFPSLLSHYQAIASHQDQLLFLSGIGLITLSLLFKAAVFPFHQWAPDVYAGAPTSITAFMAIAIKTGAFAALAILFLLVLPNFNPLFNTGLSFLCLATFFYANLVALKQVYLKRFFAYSGIAQASFLLLPIIAGLDESLEALIFYLIVYALATLGCFAAISAIESKEEGPSLHDLKGLFKRSPLIAFCFSLCLLTLAGIPPLPGFLAKFFVLKGVFQAGYPWLMIAGLFTSTLSIYYYLRPIAIMLGTPEEPPLHLEKWHLAVGSIACILLLALTFSPFLLSNPGILANGNRSF